ncbi:MAG TPA: UxaA family hydrolase [Candidatus Nanopelagicaceae bacterium]|nr:UxaA family hydrolase [Candidatus Nanopelagicaceae bacterium]
MSVKFLVHHENDSVGVAVVDIAPNTDAEGRYRDQAGELRVKVTEAVPLGHKIAIKSMAKGDQVLEYGAVIGLATKDIGLGEAVHVHNLKGQRWN